MSLSFQSRLVVFFSLLLVAVQGLTLLAIAWFAKFNVNRQMTELLATDARVFSRLLMERGERIANEARLLAADFGFKSTVAADDPATLRSALQNLVYRIHGQRGLFVGLDGNVVATTNGTGDGSRFPFGDALEQADEHGKAVFFGRLDDRLYEWAIVPVLAPLPIGFIAIALTADQGLVEPLSGLTPAHMDITLVEESARGVQTVASSLSPTLHAELSRLMTQETVSAIHAPTVLNIGDKSLLTQRRQLPGFGSDGKLVAWLQVDLDQALQPYTLLHYTVVGILIAGLAASLLGGILIARRIARPVRQLAAANTQLLQGRFEAPLNLHRDDELGRLAETFNRAGRMAAELNDLKLKDRQHREFVANVSHDIRSPLTALRGYLETMTQSTALPVEQRQQYLETALRQSEKVSRLAQELFDLASLDNASDNLQKEAFGLSDLVQDVVQKYALRALQNNVRLTTTSSADLPWVVGDICLLERVLTNLIDNALTHTPSGGEVNVSVQPDTDWLRVAVTDTGIGIPHEHLPTLFDRQSSLRRVGRRTSGGLGLIIVGKILSMHGARIEVESHPNAGSTFRFELPIASGPSVNSR